jgi:hypothetical protein
MIEDATIDEKAATLINEVVLIGILTMKLLSLSRANRKGVTDEQ